jgi:hypothetical protein
MVLRANAKVQLAVASPQLGTLRQPDCLILNELPFTQVWAGQAWMRDA